MFLLELDDVKDVAKRSHIYASYKYHPRFWMMHPKVGPQHSSGNLTSTFARYFLLLAVRPGCPPSNCCQKYYSVCVNSQCGYFNTNQTLTLFSVCCSIFEKKIWICNGKKLNFADNENSKKIMFNSWSSPYI